MKQDELPLEKMKYSSRQDHKHELTAVISAGMISYHSIINCKREPHYYIEKEVVLRPEDQAVKTNNSCTLNCSADSSHLIYKVTAVNTNVPFSCFADQNVKYEFSYPPLSSLSLVVAVKQTVAC